MTAFNGSHVVQIAPESRSGDRPHMVRALEDLCRASLPSSIIIVDTLGSFRDADARPGFGLLAPVRIVRPGRKPDGVLASLGILLRCAPCALVAIDDADHVGGSVAEWRAFGAAVRSTRSRLVVVSAEDLFASGARPRASHLEGTRACAF